MAVLSTSRKSIGALAMLGALAVTTFFYSPSAAANSCSRADIEYYLQRGFSNDQVVQLCAGPTTAVQNNQQYQAPVAPLQINPLREDESYLSAALDAETVKLSNDKLVVNARECIEYGPPNNSDLWETICTFTKLTLPFNGLQIGKSQKGIFLVRDATVDVTGNIQREFTALNELRRQDREAILETLKTNPRNVALKVRRGIEPKTVADRLRKYIK